MKLILTLLRSYCFIIIVALYCLLPISVSAQQTSVTIRLINTKKEPLPFASVSVTSVKDSTQSIDKVSDSSGTVKFTLANGQYLVSVSSVNYAPFQKGITVKSENPVFTFTADVISKSLQGVNIVSSRPVMRQEDDKTIVDPENLITSSTNAYEILEKTPGLFVDQDGNIYLNSTTPATVYINGREQKMSASDIATMLKNLPPNSIASIEILRTPSAKYDASGSGGIVNVVLKKGVKIGLTGSVTLGGNQGKYGNQFVGLNLNNNNGKTTTYLNMQYGHRNYYEEVRTDRLFAADSLLSQDAFSLYPTNNYYTGFGINSQVTKKWELSYDGRINYSNFINTTTNLSQIKKVSNNNLITDNITGVTNKGNNFNLSQGVSAKYKIDSAGSEWSTDISYNYSPNTSNQAFATAFTVPVYPAISGDGKIKTHLDFFSAQTNLLFKFPKQFTVETGLKSTSVGFTNTTEYFRQNGGSRIKDVGRTSSYKYQENINAAYVQGSKTISGITVKIGTRLENTNMKGNQLIPSDTSFSIHRTDLFPYVYISRNLFKIMTYDLRAYLVYRRTISRPSYQLLNPSQRYVDQYLFETGNPSLRPQFTQNYEANISVDERPILAIGVNDTKDIFTNVIYQADSNRSVSYRTYDNLGKNKEIYFRALGAIPPGKKYFIVAGIQYNHNFYQGLYEGKPLAFKKGSWSIFTYQTFKLTSTTQLQLNGFARFKGQLQFYELSSFGALNFSVTQQLMKRKLIVSVSINDIFLTNNNDFTIKQGSINASGFRKGDTRRFGLNIRYNFGFRKKEDSNLFNIESPEKTN
ncbi:MAG: TonB-dependent receptor [Chitinophagaceae bacterium]|nr:TonB-dependent receptor [Chitinophagaceae bacterium]